jgi:SAM-dependent methyltransferase
VLGVEPSPTNAALARQKFGLPVITAYLHEAGLPEAAFDVVTLVDVLEHVTEPRILLEEVHRVLRPGGVVYIKTPNVTWNFLKYRVLGRTLRWTRYDFFDIREHVVQYSQTSLTRMLRECNFRPVVWYIPRPIQSGTLWTQAARMISSVLARGILGFSEQIVPLSPDLAVVARKGEHPPSGVARG